MRQYPFFVRDIFSSSQKFDKSFDNVFLKETPFKNFLVFCGEYKLKFNFKAAAFMGSITLNPTWLVFENSVQV